MSGEKKEPKADQKVQQNGDVKGEGNHSAARRFDEAEQRFVKEHSGDIPGEARKAKAALEGPEGEALRQAEDSARSHAKS